MYDQYLKRSVEMLLEKKASPYLYPDSESETQTPEDFQYAALNHDWSVEGILAVKTYRDRVDELSFEGLPKECEIVLKFVRYKNYRKNKDDLEISLKIKWRDFLFDPLNIYEYYEDALPSFQGFTRFIADFPSIALQMEERMPYFEQKQKEREENAVKRLKTKEIRINTIRSWLPVICEPLGLPYSIQRYEARFDLSIQMPDQSWAQFQIPINHFEEVVSELPAMIQQVVDIFKNKSKWIKLYVSKP